jgi:hypothetical protein
MREERTLRHSRPKHDFFDPQGFVPGVVDQCFGGGDQTRAGFKGSFLDGPVHGRGISQKLTAVKKLLTVVIFQFI